MRTGWMKKWTGIVIAAAFVLALVPMSALAEDTTEEITINTATDFPMTLEEKAYKITLEADVVLPMGYSSFSGVPKGGSLILDLNGHTFSMENGWFCNYGTLLITDSSADSSGVFNQSPIGKVCLMNSGSLTVEGGSFGTTTKTDEDWNEYYAIVNAYTDPNDTELIITGGEFYGSICQFDSCITETSITGGTFHKSIDITKGRLEISGGTFDETVSIPDGGLYISSGAFKQRFLSAWGREFRITGGTFQYNPALCYDDKPVNFATHDIVLQEDGGYAVQENASGASSVGAPVMEVRAERESSIVTLSSTTEGAVIYYSNELNGTYTQYTVPLVLTENKAVYAYSVKENLCSDYVHQYVTIGYAEPPTASPAGGTYTDSVQVTLTAENGANILYTTDDDVSVLTGSTAMNHYTGPFTLTKTTTVRAIADNNGKFSEMMTAVYTITKSGGNGSGNGGGSSSGGSSSGSSSSNQNTGTTTNNSDGSKTTTVTDKTTGNVTATTTAKNGTVTKVETTKNGAVSSIEATISANAVQSGEPIVLASSVPVALRGNEAVAVTVTLPKNAGPVKIAIPVEKATAGTVAVIVDADGKEKIVPTSLLTDDGLMLKLDNSATVKIVDNSKTFTDLSGKYWATDAIAFATSRELFHGTSATTFTPDAPMTRQMLMTVLARLDGADTSDSTLVQGMAWAVEQGISDGTNPSDSISREQLAVMLYRYASSPVANGNLDTFHDANIVGGHAQAAMQWTVSSGIISGKGDGVLDPHGEATRAQVATMLQRYVINLSK